MFRLDGRVKVMNPSYLGFSPFFKGNSGGWKDVATPIVETCAFLRFTFSTCARCACTPVTVLFESFWIVTDGINKEGKKKPFGGSSVAERYAILLMGTSSPGTRFLFPIATRILISFEPQNFFVTSAVMISPLYALLMYG